MNTLGLIATKRRNIQSGLEYDHLFPVAKMQDDVVIRDGNVKDTVHLMADVVNKYIDDTKLIAPKLKGKNLEQTCRNIWDFVYDHIQYKLDQKGLEQLRRPARSWYDRISGVDCDCYSIFISSILANLGIPHKFRITKYEGDWQHVYVAVPKSQGSHYLMDCVVDEFNYEKPYTEKFEYNMTTLNGLPIAVLSGPDPIQDEELYGILTGVDFAEIDYLEGMGKIPSDEQELRAIYNHLVRTRDYIMENPKSVLTSGGAAAHLQMLNYAIDNWNTPGRDKALEILEQEEERWNQHNGVSGLDGEDDDDGEINGLGAIKARKKFFKNIKEAVKKVGQGVKKVGQKVGEVAKKAVKAIVRYNPLTLAVRGGFLLAMKINLLGFAKKLYPAYLSESEAKTRGITTDKWQRAKNALAKVEKLFVGTLQGKAENMKKAIMNGRAAKQFKGFGELGEPATIATVVASAAPLIKVAGEIKSAGLTEKGEDTPADEKGFIQKIKEWWKKSFGKETALAPETVSDAEKAPDEKAESGDAESGDDKGNDKPEGEGFISKVGSFVKENPGKTAIGIAVIGTAIALAVSPKARKAVGLGAVPKRKHRKPKRNPIPIMNLN
ncbi:MAG: hypothetical protein HY840_07885 [Bacteroidetes bacterium]|nr:hypothetical protein [Bacteroidota bacterium]